MDDRQSCDSLWDLLSAYADGDVTDDEARLVDRHVASCPECARALGFLRAVDTDLDLQPDYVPTPPEDLHLRILEATVRQSSAHRGRPRFANASAMLPALASAAVVALVGFVWGSSLNDPFGPHWIPTPQMPHQEAAQAARPQHPMPVPVDEMRAYEGPVGRGFLASRSMARPLVTLVVAPRAQSRWTVQDRSRMPAMQSEGAVEEPTRSAVDPAPTPVAPAAVPDLRMAAEPAPATNPSAASRTTADDDTTPPVATRHTNASIRLVSAQSDVTPEMMGNLAALRPSTKDMMEAQEMLKARIAEESPGARRVVKVEATIGRF